MWLNHLRTTLRMLAARRLRSALAMVGIFAGILAVVLIMSIHEGTRQQVEVLYKTNQAHVFLVLPRFEESQGRAGTLDSNVARLLANDPYMQTCYPRISSQEWVRSWSSSYHIPQLPV